MLRATTSRRIGALTCAGLGVAILAALAADPAGAYTQWNDLRASALQPGGVVTLRVENPQGTGAANTILFQEAGVQEWPMAGVPDGLSTVEATVPGPVAERRRYGFRFRDNETHALLAVRLPEGFAPQWSDLTRLADDPVGDEAFGRTHLDLVECRIARDETRLYAALINAGGGFPVSQGFTFFSYLLGIKDPSNASPDTLFAMIHTVNVSGIIEPGLYQINGTGVSDLVKIGEITATEYPTANTLMLSCLLADLEANAVFQSWYDASDPRLDVAGFTQKITVLGGVDEADLTAGGIWHLREVALDPVANHRPLISGLDLADPGASASVVYADPDGHCPVLAELVFDGADSYPLRPQSLEYTTEVLYISESNLPPLVSGTWSHVVARFSDDLAEVVELAAFNSGIDEDEKGRRSLRIAPNPFRDSIELAFVLDRPQRVQLTIHDAEGRRVAAPLDAVLPSGTQRIRWDGHDAEGQRQPEGVYFFRLHGHGRTIVQPVVRMR